MLTVVVLTIVLVLMVDLCRLWYYRWYYVEYGIFLMVGLC